MQEIIQFLDRSKIKYVQDLPMKSYTTFKVGGTASLVVYPENSESTALLVRYFRESGKKYIVLGNGSNVIFPDGGIQDIVLKTDLMKNISVHNNIISLGAGVLNAYAANIALKQGLSGLEFLHGIPGSIGGAVYMNAGAYGEQVSDIIVQTTYIDDCGQIQKIDRVHHEYGYRKSIFTNKDVICYSNFQLKKGDSTAIKDKMTGLMQRRKTSQPLTFPSAGSVFKRPEGFYTGKLIEDCGLKGFCIGGAQVSQKHAGFIINTGNATSKDIVSLIHYIQKTVYEKFGVELETEVKIL